MATPEEELVSKLFTQIRLSDDMLERFLAKRKAAIESFVGPEYGDSDEGARPINPIYMLVQTLLPLFVARNPKADITSEVRELRPVGYALELADDMLCESIGFAKTLRRICTDAVFGMGVGRIGLGASGQGPLNESLAETGQPFFEHISLGKFGFDAGADTLESAYWMGNRYTLALPYVRDSGLFELPPDDLDKLKTEARRDLDKTASDISHARGIRERFVDTVEVWDIYLPPGNEIGGGKPVIITIPTRECGLSRILRTTEWNGPEAGPYLFLGFMEVPDNALPLSPVATIQNLDTLINAVAKKLRNQAMRSKNIVAYDKSAGPDAERIRNARDGDMIDVSNVDRIKEITFGGMNERLLGTLQFFLAMFSRQGGNVNLIGGLGAETPTATQEGLLQANSDLRIRDMQSQVYALAEKALFGLTWFLWTDPMIRLPLVKRIPGLGQDIQVPVTFSQDYIMDAVRQMQMPDEQYDPRGVFLKYHFRIKPYSMEIQSPSQRIEKLFALTERLLLPLTQIGAIQGKVPNVEAIIRLAQKELDLSEIDEMLVDVGPQGMLAGNLRTPMLPSRPRQTARGGAQPMEAGPEGIELPPQAQAAPVGGGGE